MVYLAGNGITQDFRTLIGKRIGCSSFSKFVSSPFELSDAATSGSDRSYFSTPHLIDVGEFGKVQIDELCKYYDMKPEDYVRSISIFPSYLL